MENDRTEAEASGSMCVFTRRLLTAEMDQRVEGMIAAVAKTKQVVPGAFNQWAEGDQVVYTPCLGSRCMGWFWTESPDRGLMRRGRCGYRTQAELPFPAFPETRQ